MQPAATAAAAAVATVTLTTGMIRSCREAGLDRARVQPGGAQPATMQLTGISLAGLHPQ